MRWVFVGTGGFLGRIDSETRCAFWSEEPVDHGFDPARLIPIDLALTPNRAIAGEIGWDAVQVDDCFSGPTGDLGGTTLGSRWLEIQISGAVFLEQGFLDSLPTELRPPCPPKKKPAISIHVVSSTAEDVLIGASARCTDRYRIGSLEELRAVLESLLARSSAPPAYLDLFGHSTREGRLLRLGTPVIDMLDPAIERFFRSLASDRLLLFLNVIALRLLGCETAVEPTGQRTMRSLARTLRIPVFGARKPLMKSHYNEHGFDPAFGHILIESALLPNPSRRLGRC